MRYATLFVEHLTVLDCCLLHPKRGLIGESFIVDVTLSGQLDDQGMVFDFALVKKTLKNALESMADHKLLVAKNLPGLSLTYHLGQLTIEWAYPLKQHGEPGHFFHRSPANAVTVFETEHITVAYLQDYLTEHAKQVLPDNVTQLAVSLRHETIDGAYYHYGHGLKKHQGDCQRIAHGHRSRLEVYQQQKRQKQIEHTIADLLCDKYLGTTEDLKDYPIFNGINHCHFAYLAQEGEFELILPKQSCYLLETDSTVEYIALHIADWIQHKYSGEYTIRAFEGVNKGALGYVKGK